MLPRLIALAARTRDRWAARRDPSPRLDSAFAPRAAVSPATWVVSARQAAALLQQGATLLEAHNPTQPLPGAQPVDWQDFSPPEPSQRGEVLAADAVLAARLASLGVRGDRPVVVVGDPLRGWGEAGRIVWMLRSLGHPAAVFVDGGYAALAAADLPPERPSQPGSFTPQRSSDWTASQDQVRASLGASGVVLLDTREAREYAGATLYGEPRGGHLPGARHLHFRALLDSQGYLLPRAEIETLLTEQGITSETAVIAYCTGGVRSAWVTAVLADLGYRAKNYAGSVWQWAAAPEATHPLEMP